MDAKLVMFKADGERREFSLKGASTVLGRKRTCDLRIPLPSVSREHARIEKRDDGLYLRDLGSSNGTYINEDRVREEKIEAGDTFRIGPVNFTLVVNGKPANVKPVKTVLPGDETGVRAAQGAGASRGPGDSDTLRAAVEEEGEDAIEILEDEEDERPASSRRSRPETPAEAAKQNGSAEPAAGGEGRRKERDEDEDPIAALEDSVASDEEEDSNDASDTFDAIFGTGDDDDDSVPVFDDDEKKP